MTRLAADDDLRTQPFVARDEPLPDDAAAIIDEETPMQRARRRLPHLTARAPLALVAVVLALILVVLIVYLVSLIGRPQALGDRPAVQGVQPVWQVYGPGEGDRPLFNAPMGVAVGKGDRIYVTDAGNNRVCIFDSRGRFLSMFGTTGIAKPEQGVEPTYVPGSLNYPVGIDTDDDGNVYVASFRNDSVEVFDAEGAPLMRFPDPSKPVGEGSSGLGGTGIAVTDVAISGDRVYALDTYQVVVFSRDGEFVDQWGAPGVEPESLDHPNGIAVSDDGDAVYVSDSNHSRVTAFSPTGQVLWQVGSIPSATAALATPELELPRGLTVMPDGSVLVSDAFAFALVRISPVGEVIARYGERGVEPGQLNFSNDIESFRGFLTIVDKENGRLQVVRLVN